MNSSTLNKNFLDYESLWNAVSARKENEKRRKAIRQEIIDEHTRGTVLLQTKNAERQRAAEEAKEKYLQQKKHDESVILQKAEQHALQEEQKLEREINALHTQTRRALRLVTFNGISQCQETFRDKYSSIVKLLVACQRTEISQNGHNKSLKELTEQFEQLIAKLKSNDYGPTELRTAQRICESIETLEEKIVSEVELIIARSKEKAEESFRRIAAAEEEERQRQLNLEQEELNKQLTNVEKEQEVAPPLPPQENLTPAQAPPPPAEATTAVTTTATTTTTTVDAAVINSNEEGLLKYSQIMAYYLEVVDKVKTLKNDESLKKYRFACQKAINTPINAISAVSPQHLQDKFDRLFGFINGQPSNDVRVTDHPLGRDYSLLIMAKKFVSQATTAISSNPQAAFPVAAVVVSIWKLVPEFGQLFLAYLYKESPYMVPCILKQQEGQTPEDFFKQLGYHFTNGQIESGESYLKRQSGITRLYAAVIITSGRQSDGPTHPYGLTQGWQWLAKIVYMPPLPDLCATILTEFLYISGASMLTHYGKQFIKLLIFIQRVYFPQLAAIDKGGPKTRLELQLQKFLQEGRIEVPVGMLPAAYW